MTTIVWFQNDLRVDDHAPLMEAKNVLPLYIHWEKMGSGQQKWLESALNRLKKALPTLRIEKGDPLEILRKTGAKRLFLHKRYEPFHRDYQEKLQKILTQEGWEVKIFKGHLLVEPEDVKPYKVFTPFYKHLISRGLDVKPLSEHPSLAKEKLDHFLKTAHKAYQQERDFPAINGTSKLSPYLAFGEISPRTIWWSIDRTGKSADPYLRQLVWRDFAYHLFWYHPETETEPLRPEYKNFPWVYNKEHFERWKEGMTGFPIVDAGMRQLKETGWMHNRLRMIVGSFLVKDLLLPWQWGADWFMEKLIDADLANNTFGWQWVAGCGADAAPYFRVFNPELQEKKFDPNGEYLQKWIPELKTSKYPPPMVDHAEAKERALAAWEKIR